MYGIIYIPTNTVIDVCATEDTAQRILAESLGSSPNFTVQRMTLEDALAHLRRFDATRHDSYRTTAV